ncbi:hypothetical protein AMTRI_Chr03g46840 [Amborella trichopoda]
MTAASLIPFFSLIAISLLRAGGADPCSGRYIFIQHLPPRFNRDLLADCAAYPVWQDFCPYKANLGLGPKTHNGTSSWFRTDPYLLEPLFHARMYQYPCLTPDPDLASAVFLPYYASLHSLPFLFGPDQNYSIAHGLDLARLLSDSSVYRRRHGHDYFFVASRTALDFSRPLDSRPDAWGTSLLELPAFFNFTVLVTESRAWPWQEHAVPYPTSFHPSTLSHLHTWLRRVRRSPRPTLMLFAGGATMSPNGPPNIHRSILSQCASTAESICSIADCSRSACDHDPGRYMRPMLRARFCLQPPSDTPTRRSTFDGMIAGCIPVFFEDRSAKSQYDWHMRPEEYRDFSVFIAKDEVVWGGLNISRVLMGIGDEEVRRMREKVIEMIPRIIYRGHRSSKSLREEVKDAFDLAVEGVIRKIKHRISNLGVD